MQFTIPQKKLIELMQYAQPFASTSRTLPVLSHFLIVLENNILSIKSTNMENSALVSMPLQGEDGGLSVSSSEMLSIIKLLEGDISISTTDSQMNISAGKDKFKIKGFPVSEFPATPPNEGDGEFVMKLGALKEAIHMSSFCILPKNFSPVFTGMYIKAHPTHICFVGTDTYRLAEYKVDIEGKEIDNIVPKTFVVELQKVFNGMKGDFDVTIVYNKRLVGFKIQYGDVNISINGLCIQGTYPDYTKIIPTDTTTTISIDDKEMLGALKKIMLLTREYNNYVHITTNNNGTLELSSGNKSDGEAQTSIPAVIEGLLNLGLNGSHLTVLSGILGDYSIAGTNDKQPILITSADYPNFLYITRPIKG